MNLKTLTIAGAILFTSNLKAKDLPRFIDTAKFNYNLIVDPSITFLFITELTAEVGIGVEWNDKASPDRRWEIKANYGIGPMWIIGIADSGDVNGISHMYYLESNYSRDILRWRGRKSSKEAGYFPRAVFIKGGVLGGILNQHATIMYIWDPIVTVPIDENEFSAFAGVQAGLGYRYNFQNKLIINFIPISLTVYYDSYYRGYPGIFPTNIFDFQFILPLN